MQLINFNKNPSLKKNSYKIVIVVNLGHLKINCILDEIRVLLLFFLGEIKVLELY